MKLSKYLVGTLACALMAGCANEDVQENVQTGSGGKEAYMAVNLIAPNVTSRATFDEGSGNESTVGSARFYFFDNEGNAVDVNGNVNYIDLTSGITLTDPTPDSEGDNVDIAYNDSANEELMEACIMKQESRDRNRWRPSNSSNGDSNSVRTATSGMSEVSGIDENAINISGIDFQTSSSHKNNSPLF